MSNLEDRLRSELSREGRAANIGPAPSVDSLADVATGRRRRNRTAGIVAGVALTAGIVVGGGLALLPDRATDVVAAGDSTAEPAAQTESQPDTVDGTVAAGGAESENEPDLDVASVEDLGEVADVESDASEISDEPNISLAANGTSSAEVETRTSAVDFFGSSGVLIAPTSDGLAGVASRFTDSGIEAIGLVSSNGLDWDEVPLTGIADGAVATALESYSGTHVATFERNVSGERSTWVGTSTDLVNWELSDPLVGDFVVAQQLLVGPNGVVVLGDMTEPDVWSGPIGGPYEARDQVPARSIGAAAVIDGEFVVLGVALEESEEVLFHSTDGLSWTSESNEVSSPTVAGSGIFSFGDEGAVVFNPLEGATSYVSSDLGATWTEIDHGGGLSGLALQASGANGATGILAGSDSLTVVLADNESVSIAEVPDVGVVNRSSLVSVEADRAVVLIETEAGLTWAVVSR